jgi:polar amino acid transport system substrate-binding protein
MAQRQKRGLPVMAAAILACATLAACGSSSTTSAGSAPTGGSTSQGDALLTQMQNAKSASVGVVAQPPYSNITPSGGLSGLAPALSSVILKNLDVPSLDGHLATYGSAIPGLLAGRWDMVASALDITPARCSVVIFSIPFDVGYDVFAVKPGNPLGIHTLKDVVNKHATIGILAGGAEIGVAESLGVPSSNISSFPNDATEVADLEAGRVDAIMESSVSFNVSAAWVQAKGHYQLTGPISDFPYSAAGFAFRKSDVALRNAVNQQIEKLMASGELQKLRTENGFPATMPSATGLPAGCT